MAHGLLKKYGIWELLLVFAFLFAMPMRVYVPTSFIIELVSIIMLVAIPKWPNYVVNKTYLEGHLFFLLILLVLGILLGTTNPPFFTESYRYFTFFIFLTVLKISRVNYENLLRLCFYGCVFCAIFSIYELVHLNFLHFGEYNSIPILGPASREMYVNEASDYLSQQWFLGIPYFRPMGFFIQPQKSGFIYVIGTICTYLIYRNEKGKAYLGYLFFTCVVVATAAKTAIVSQLLVIAVAALDLYPRAHLRGKEILRIAVVSIPVLFYAIVKIFGKNHMEESGVILGDITAFFNYPPINWLTGIGIPTDIDLRAHGFECECYMARLLAQVGLIFFTIELLWGFSIIRTKSKKFNWILISLLFGLFSHYCVINAYFMTFSFAVVICYAQSLSKQELE